MTRREFDIGIVIPLIEEYRYVVEVAPQIEMHSHEGTYFYSLDFGSVSTVCCISGRMGPLPALQTATKLLAFADIKLLVVLGLGGALDDDVLIGDVVVAEEVNEFQANSKAESHGESYEVRYSGRHWSLDYAIRESIGHFEFAGPAAFANWQKDVANEYASLEINNKEEVCSFPPSLHVGPIASGNVVAASTAFVNEVRRINRKFVAIDMEAAGVAIAASDRVHPIPCLVVRGMSDHANEGKKDLDGQGKGAWRRYCVKNATSFLKHLLSWEGFQSACGLKGFSVVNVDDRIRDELLSEIRNAIGGPWIVGILFGTYNHGPRVEEGSSVVPIDISRLQVVDSRFSDLMNTAVAVKNEAIQSGEIGSGARRLMTLLEDYRDKLNSPEVDSLLQDFDGVVVETLCPEKTDERFEAVLLEADRLDEEVGAEAVIELLKDLLDVHQGVRERYIDALATLKRWQEIIDSLTGKQLDELSRRELENLIYGHIKIGSKQMAVRAMKVHETEFDDKGAKLFRFQLANQHAELSEFSKGETK